MFLGQYQLLLNDDNSLVIPKSFREFFPDGAYITRGFEQNLLVMSSRGFEEIHKRAAGLNITDPLARLLRRLILGNASRLEMDKAGHVVIPQALRSFASLDKEIVLVGQGDYFEVWAPANWDKQAAELLDFDANSGRFAGLELAIC